MNYNGALYGHLGGRRYIKLALTSEDVDRMERELAEARETAAGLEAQLKDAMMSALLMTSELAEARDLRDQLSEELRLGMITMEKAEGVIYGLIEQRDRLAEALRPFAKYSCDRKCYCTNCNAREALATVEGGPEQ